MSQHHPQPGTCEAEAQQDPAQLEFDGQAGAALHRRRRGLGLTATEVARRVGISQRRMARLELGLEPLTLRLAIGLGVALGMPAAWFLRLDAAALPEAIGIALDEAQSHWAQALAMRLAEAGAAGMQH